MSWLLGVVDEAAGVALVACKEEPGVATTGEGLVATELVVVLVREAAEKASGDVGVEKRRLRGLVWC